MLPAYELSVTLEGHSQDVRALCAPDSDTIVSASRDTSAKVWKRSKDGTWSLSRTMNDPNGKFVSSLAWVVLDAQPYIACGSGSSTITLYPANDESAAPTSLQGHAQNVCCLSSNENGFLISGSWDKTAIVWKKDKQLVRYTEHTQAVWDVKCLPDDRFLTASADKTINMLDVSGVTLATFFGHTDCVRSISIFADGSGFWSGGNDAQVLKWSFGSDRPVATLSGHSSFVYAVASSPNGEGVVSSGEDGTVRVWKGNAVVQTIVHPTVSVWTVEILPSGDILSGASDSAVRIFTQDEERVADREVLELWGRAVAGQQINKAQVGDVKHSDLPGMEALAKQGQSEGQVIMIKNEGTVQAYQWQISGQTWQQIGEVVDAVGSGRKQLYKGVEYDYVFDVDIADGVPPLKLPFNSNENPYAAAERFLNMNELPLTYTDQVVKFIESNTKGVEIGGPQYVDPFTGGGAYRAGAAGPSQKSTNDAPAYRNPYAAGSDHSSQAQGKAQKAFTPIKEPQYYKQINVAAVQSKIAEFVQANRADGASTGFHFQQYVSHRANAYSEQLAGATIKTKEEATFAEIVAQLSLPALAQKNATERWDVGVLLSAMTRWPPERRFPLIDVCRALCGTSETIVSTSSDMEGSLVESLLKACDWDLAWDDTKSRNVNTMLALRAIANLTSTPAGRDSWSRAEAPEILDRLASFNAFAALNKQTRVAYASIALNLSVLAAEGELPNPLGSPLLRLITTILSEEKEDGEVVYRTVVAMGNVVTSPTLSGALPVGDVQIAKEIADALARRVGEQRLMTVIASLG